MIKSTLGHWGLFFFPPPLELQTLRQFEPSQVDIVEACVSHTAARCYLNPGLTRHPITSRLGTRPARSAPRISAAGASAFSSLWNQNNLFAARSFYSFSHVAVPPSRPHLPSSAARPPTTRPGALVGPLRSSAALSAGQN